MKLVFTTEEVAEALGQSEAAFEELRPSLEALGFPKPVAGLGDRWAIMEVISWVNGGGACLSMATTSTVSNEDASGSRH